MSTTSVGVPFKLMLSLVEPMGATSPYLTGYLRSEAERYVVYREVPESSVTVQLLLPWFQVDGGEGEFLVESRLWGINGGIDYERRDSFPTEEVVERLTASLNPLQATYAAEYLKLEMERVNAMLQSRIAVGADVTWQDFGLMNREVPTEFDARIVF